LKPAISLAVLIFCTIGANASGQQQPAGTSAYTKLDDKTCIFQLDGDSGSSVGYCAGYKGFPVVLVEGDLRQMVRFGHVDGRASQWESFGQFNRVGDTIEWRLDKTGFPYAAILRWFIEHQNEGRSSKPSQQGEVLVVSKVGRLEDPTSCVMGYVDARANTNANQLAREIADQRASDFICKSSSPDWEGVRGKLSGDPVNWFD